eukprot:GEZU01004034.1.p1 GENE.GEZU01004034.1~~GEZU01004034.1.p1  ORF type:complete len:164 (+),score=34.85 GEZU01004034.1:71-493(+)
MLHPNVVIPTTDQFDAKIAEVEKQAAETGKHIFVHFSGEADAQGNSWCPDCVRADPILDAAFSKIADKMILVYCPVARSEYRMNPSYPYRTHPRIKLNNVPTVIHWRPEHKGTQHERITHECDDAQAVDTFIKEGLSSNA